MQVEEDLGAAGAEAVTVAEVVATVVGAAVVVGLAEAVLGVAEVAPGAGEVTEVGIGSVVRESE